jgi:hypothetical protein
LHALTVLIVSLNPPVYHIHEEGWTYHGNHDVAALYWDYKDLKAEERAAAVGNQ